MLRIMTLLAALVASTTAMATDRTFYIGDQIELTGTLLCDEFEQIKDIVTAQQESFENAWIVYQEVTRQYNVFNEPICTFVIPMRTVTVTLVETVEMFEGVYLFDGSQSLIYITKVLWTDARNNQAEGYVTFDQEIGASAKKL